MGVGECPDSCAVLVDESRGVLSQCSVDSGLDERLVLHSHVQDLTVVLDLHPIRERDLERYDVVLDFVRNDFATVQDSSYPDDGLPERDVERCYRPRRYRCKCRHLDPTLRSTCGDGLVIGHTCIQRVITVRRTQETHVNGSPVVVTAEVRTELHDQLVCRSEERRKCQWVCLADVGQHSTMVSDDDEAIPRLTVRYQILHTGIGDGCVGAVNRRHQQDTCVLVQLCCCTPKCTPDVIGSIFECRGEADRGTEASEAGVEARGRRTLHGVVPCCHGVAQNQDVAVARGDLFRVGCPEDGVVQVLERRSKLATRVVERL
ncbi:hypothetical protein D3C81_1330040 [compost metagenome]